MNGLEKQCCPKKILLTQQEESSEGLDSCCAPSDADATDNAFAFFGQLFQANLAKWTAGISPAALGSSYSTWLWQLAQSPEVLWELAFYPVFHANDCINNIICVDRAAGGKDVRFKKDSWQPMPWRLYAEGFFAGRGLVATLPQPKFLGYPAKWNAPFHSGHANILMPCPLPIVFGLTLICFMKPFALGDLISFKAAKSLWKTP